MDWTIISSLLKNGKGQLLACDEVGRGPLAGPVVACTVALDFKGRTPKDIKTLLTMLKGRGVTDSKKITAKKRKQILTDLGIDINTKLNEKKCTISLGKNFKIDFFLVEISASYIDQINILQASLLAMSLGACHLAKKNRGPLCLVDGNKVPLQIEKEMEASAIVKGDSKSVLIGLASLIAKEYRDLLMEELAIVYPYYGLEKNAGYPTTFHKQAIAQHGPCLIHRKTFKGVKEYC